MRKLSFLAIAVGLFLVGCSQHEEEAVVNPTTKSELKLGESITANFGTSSMTITTTSEAKAPGQPGGGESGFGWENNNGQAQEDNNSEQANAVTACFYVRVDSYIPTTEEEENGMAPLTYNYYPQTSTGDSDHNLAIMQKQIDKSQLGQSLYLLDSYGRYTAAAFLEDAPSMDDIRTAFKDGVIKYDGTVVYDKSQGIDLLDDYKVIWYVAKYVSSDADYHVDGALVPKNVDNAPLTDDEKKHEGTDDDKSDESKKEIEEEKEQSNDTDIEIDLDLENDIVLEVDDFDIRKSGVGDYIAYEKAVDSNTLEYNGVTVTRDSNMKLTISGLNNLDWSEEGTIWTFEAYLWAKFDMIPSSWSYGDTDKTETIENALYNIEYHYYQGYQSEGTVPYVKVSIHVTKK